MRNGGYTHPITWLTFSRVNTHSVRMNTRSHKQVKNSGRAQAVRVNISLPPTLRLAAETVTSRKGYVGLSDYVQAYLRKDAAALGMREFEMAQ